MTGLPLTTRFRLGPTITSEQHEFLQENGFLVFARVAGAEELERLLTELARIEQRWLRERRRTVYGTPLFIGRDATGQRCVQRFAFTSCFSDYIREFVRDERLAPIRDLIGANARVGDQEKDGVVVNRFMSGPQSVAARLGWHTDGLRDLFYLRTPKRMLNVGVHFDRVAAADGGLRLIPGTHRQGFAKMCFRKPYFVSHGEDPDELAIETEPGDLTVHDGRLWHRVAASPHRGPRSVRRTMYVPYLTDAEQLKDERSSTPLYHHVGRVMRRAKTLRARF